ncbi:hypothetical protein H4Q26_014170, partial [Puccinia striiformis f. sp. tritici PST-130]
TIMGLSDPALKSMLSWFSNHLSKTKSSFSFVIRILLITNQLQPVELASIPYGPGRLAGNLSNSTNLQSLFNISSALTRPSRHLSPHHTPPGIPQKETDSILLDGCMSRPLSPRLWMEMGMNEFLRDYRNGEKLNLLVLAICYLIALSACKGKEWYILVAAQEWNTFMNAAYQSIGWAMTMMQGVAPSLVHDFYPDLPDTWSIIKAILTFRDSVASTAAIWEQQDPCTGAGPNGAWGGDKMLSYCGPDNVMMNIIQAKGKHAVNHVHNAKLVTEKYNFSVKFLTEAAWNCQKQSGKFEFDVWNSFNLPVCDLTRPGELQKILLHWISSLQLIEWSLDIRAYRDSGAGTVAACRIIGGLPSRR